MSITIYWKYLSFLLHTLFCWKSIASWLGMLSFPLSLFYPMNLFLYSHTLFTVVTSLMLGGICYLSATAGKHFTHLPFTILSSWSFWTFNCRSVALSQTDIIPLYLPSHFFHYLTIPLFLLPADFSSFSHFSRFLKRTLSSFQYGQTYKILCPFFSFFQGVLSGNTLEFFKFSCTASCFKSSLHSHLRNFLSRIERNFLCMQAEI